jgi:hypothetical protein
VLGEARVATTQTALERARLLEGLALSHDLVYVAAPLAAVAPLVEGG